MIKNLTESLEDYLEAIAELCVDNGHAHTKEIAEKLHVKMPSVTGALRQLAQMGYIIYNTHYPVELTAAGKQVAEQIAARHKVLKRFFMDILGMESKAASNAACHLEHLIDENTAARFVLFSEAIENRRDAAALRTFLSEAMELMEKNASHNCRTLDTIKRGETVTVQQISRNLGTDVFKNGDRISLASLPLDHTHLHLLVNGEPQEIDISAAENIFIN